MEIHIFGVYTRIFRPCFLRPSDPDVRVSGELGNRVTSGNRECSLGL